MAITPEPSGEFVAVVLPTLFCGSVKQANPRDNAIIDVALRWQKMGVRAKSAEIHGVLNGISEGRLFEIIGRIAAAGEQLGLASTCSRDAHSWLARAEDTASQRMAARSLAEITGYYTISTGHGLANITLRTLLLHSSAAGIINSEYKGAEGFPPFTDSNAAWRSLNADLVRTLETSAQAVNQPAVLSMVNVVAELLKDARWGALAARRSVDFHRWRPQSVSRAVPPGNPWQSLPDGGRAISVKGHDGGILTDHEGLVQEADYAVDALTAAMGNWLRSFPGATRELGVPIFKTSGNAG